MQVNLIDHPLKEGQVIRASRPSCQCRGAKIEHVEGKIGKVIRNNAGFWYYLSDIGVTVKGEWVEQVLR